MDLVYQLCAWVGGALIVCQFVLTLIGIGAEADVDTGGGEVDFDAGHAAASGHDFTNWLFGVLTFRTIVAGLAFFGLTGMAMKDTEATPGVILLCAIVAGCIAVVIVAWIMRSLANLSIDGTVRIERAVGSTGTVYLSIPGSNGGAGKVHVGVSGRTMEYKAMTPYDDLPTGSKIVVVKIVGSDTVEVVPEGSLETAPNA